MRLHCLSAGFLIGFSVNEVKYWLAALELKHEHKEKLEDKEEHWNGIGLRSCQRYSFYSLNGAGTLGVFDSSLLIGWALLIGLGQAALREISRVSASSLSTRRPKKVPSAGRQAAHNIAQQMTLLSNPTCRLPLYPADDGINEMAIMLAEKKSPSPALAGSEMGCHSSM
ncbi:hypothetical protein MHYP_G00078510 [Metynnis hypsauchen]